LIDWLKEVSRYSGANKWLRTKLNLFWNFTGRDWECEFWPLDGNNDDVIVGQTTTVTMTRVHRRVPWRFKRIKRNILKMPKLFMFRCRSWNKMSNTIMDLHFSGFARERRFARIIPMWLRIYVNECVLNKCIE
jgi:hypothetical protein